MPLDEWRRGGHDMEVPEGTEYIGSFDINYEGKVSGKIFDVYITKRFGYLEAVMSGVRRQEQLESRESRRRENVIHDGKDIENNIDETDITVNDIASMMSFIDIQARIMGVVGFSAMLIGTITLGTELWQALLASSVFGIFMILLVSKDE